MTTTVLIQDILTYLDEIGICYTFVGDRAGVVSGFASLSQYHEGCFTWGKTQKNVDNIVLSFPVRLAFLQPDVSLPAENYIVTQDSKHAFFSTIEHFYDMDSNRPAIGQGTYLSPLVALGQNVRIGCNCTLDGDITIGDDTVIQHNVTIESRASIGKRCVIQSGCHIGTDGFGYVEDANHVKTMIRHFGGVSIGDDVLISSNCVIVRGTIDNTVIMDGSKIDTLCHIAHNVRIEKHCSIITSTLLYGSTTIKENAYIASALVRNQCTVGESSIVGMGAVVTHDVPPNTTVVGNPAKSLQDRRNL